MSRSTFINKHRNRLSTCLVILSVSLVLMVSVMGVAQAAGTVTGLVYRDYNANGLQDANEPGVGGVTITAYGAANTVIGTTTSSAGLPTLGTYSISWVSADVRVRLEFTGLPGVAQQGAASSTANGSGTSVQYVTNGAVANYGINRPSDYCLATANLQLVTSCFELGAQTSGTEPVVVSNDYAGPPFGPETTVAVDTQVGTTWGIAYRRAPVGNPTGSGTIYVSAFAKRQADYGPNGSGAIYAIDGTTFASTLVTTLNAGPTIHNPVPSYAVDANFYAAPGKEGLGDMDISEDGNTLYVVNLFDQNLYSIDLTAVVPTATARGIIGPPLGTCINGVYRPFGLGIRDGLVYVGGVCTAETEPVSATMSNSLQAFVFSFNPATNVSTQVLNFPLNYVRGCTDIFAGYGAPAAPIQCRTVPLATNGSRAEWQPWRDTWPNPNQTPPGSGFSPADEFFAYPQPILAGIEFVGEDMVVSFRDRMGDQIGYLDNGPDGAGGVFPDALVTITAGDILRASPNGLGGWTIEDNARANPLVPGSFGPSGGANNEQGPGNGEFYWEDNLAGAHDETITGGIVQVPGAPEISANIMDPGTTFSAGTGWFDNGTGNRNRQLEIIPATAPFGKGNGLGDLAALCDSAPIEIGNYVWFDANQNGIQDPNEQPIAGVILTLTDALGNPILVAGNPATATTDAQGRYLFSSVAGGAVGSFVYGVPFTENTAYQVRIDTTQPNLASFTTTTPNAGGAVNNTRNSNGIQTANFAIANVTTGTAGQNDHTIDFGFFTVPYSLGNRVWLDDGIGGGGADDGIHNGTEVGIDGVTVNLLDNNGNFLASTVTAGGGYYLFDNLAPGAYIVEIPASNFTGGAPLVGLASSTDAPTSGTPNNDVDRDDNGVNLVAGGVRSNSMQIGPPGPAEPITDLDLGPGGSGSATDDHSNLTMDFGFFGTPVNPPITVTPPPGSTVPAPIRLDPAIVKLVDPKFALPGEDVRWTIEVTNPHSVAINNVTFVDNFPGELEIINASADNSVGSLVVNGNTVTYSIVVINPGQTVRVSVLTRIRTGTPVPFIITNTVNLTNGLVGSSSSVIASASATVYSSGSLPATGFAPTWREPLFIGGAILLLLFAIGFMRVRQRGYNDL